MPRLILTSYSNLCKNSRVEHLLQSEVPLNKAASKLVQPAPMVATVAAIVTAVKEDMEVKASRKSWVQMAALSSLGNVVLLVVLHHGRWAVEVVAAVAVVVDMVVPKDTRLRPTHLQGPAAFRLGNKAVMDLQLDPLVGLHHGLHLTMAASPLLLRPLQLLHGLLVPPVQLLG